MSEQTVARRYHDLRRRGVLRVVGLVDPAVHGQAQWVARIRCRPDRVEPLADSLVRRPDIAYANLSSGGSEIVCVIRSPFGGASDGRGGGDALLRKLPRSSAVLDVSVDLLIHPFLELENPEHTPDWTGYGTGLDAAERDRLTGGRPAPPSGPLLPLTDEDAPLLDALAQDGRTTHTRLAERTGWSVARVTRRLEALESSGTLSYDVDLLPERLGHLLDATLWLRVAPARLRAVGLEVAGHPEIAFVGAISGHHNLMATVICRDPEDLYRYLTTRLAGLPGIDSYEVSIRVRRLKQAASLITHGRLVHAAHGRPGHTAPA